MSAAELRVPHRLRGCTNFARHLQQIAPEMDRRPKIGADCYLAPGAAVVGQVELADRCSVWFGAVLRAEHMYIRVGPNSNIQDNAVLHSGTNTPVIIGEGVSVGHAAVVHGCTIQDFCIVGMNSTVLNGAVVGRGSIVGAGAVVKEGMQIPPCSLVLGVPGRVVKTGDMSLLEQARVNAEAYSVLREQYLKGAVGITLGNAFHARL